AGGGVGRGVVGDAVRGDVNDGGSLCDGDRDIAAPVVVIGAAGKDPVGVAAGDVGESRAEVQAGPQGRAPAIHPAEGAGGAVGGGVVHAAVAADRDHRVCL